MIHDEARRFATDIAKLPGADAVEGVAAPHSHEL
jgi:hypothetical protein